MANIFDDPDSGRSKRLWAAYVLGRYPYALKYWHDTFFWPRPDRSDYPTIPEALNAPLNEFPEAIIWDLDESVRALALLGEIDHRHHVEIRNSLYRSEAASRELLRVADEAPTNELIFDSVWASHAPLNVLMELTRAVALQSQEIQLWWQLGTVIGEWMNLLTTGDRVEIPAWSAVNEFYEQLNNPLIKERLSPVVHTWKHLVAIPNEIEERKRFTQLLFDLRGQVADLDALFLQTQQGSIVGGPLLRLDEVGEEFIFLGRQFRFKQFDAQSYGGLKCFLYLAKNPQTWCTWKEISDAADLVVEPEQVTAYFSRFRRVVKPAVEQYCKTAFGEDKRNAQRAFVIARKGKKGHTLGEQASYKLAIDAKQIELLE